MKIADDNDIALQVGETGEIWLKGPMIMQGYYNLPTETAAALTPDRFFKTGDLGKVDADGFLYVTGRKKDLIIVAGEKAVPREIEEVLMRHDSIADAAVLGKKDTSRGEGGGCVRDGQGRSNDSIGCAARFLQVTGFAAVEDSAGDHRRWMTCQGRRRGRFSSVCWRSDWSRAAIEGASSDSFGGLA